MALIASDKEARKPKVSKASKRESSLELLETGRMSSQRFFTGGHRVAGDSIKLSNGYWGAKKMKLPNNFSLSYGDILALCGDFYGNAEDGVISDVNSSSEQESRFEQYTYGCLVNDTKDPNR